MASVLNALGAFDQASQQLSSLSQSTDSLIQRFRILETVVNQALDPGVFQQTSSAISQINQTINDINHNINNVNGRITTMDNNVQTIDQSITSVTNSVNQASQAQAGLNQQVNAGKDFAEKLKKAVGPIAKMAKDGFDFGVKFINDSLSLDYIQKEAERKLQNKMRIQMGASPESIQSVKALTRAQQELGVVSDQTQLAGAGQLSSYLDSSDALLTLIPAMNHLAVYQNGAKVSAENMTSTSKLMGEAMNGNITSLSEAGIKFTQAQADLMKYGNEEQRVATLTQVISDQIGNVNEIMAQTPQGKIEQLGNAWTDIKEKVGDSLYPVIMYLFETILNNMPQIEMMVMKISEVLGVVTAILGGVMEAATIVFDFFVNNWSQIAPLLMIIAGALGFLILYQGLLSIANTATAVAQLFLNQAMYACPIFWILLIIIALIAVIYGVVAAINHFAGTSISATGIVMGAFALLGAYLINNFIAPVWNIFAAFINFFYNVWNEPIAAVKMLFYDLALNVIDYVITMAKAIEDVINKIPGAEVNITAGLDQFKKNIEAAATDIKSKSEWVEVAKKMDYKDYKDTFKSGYIKGKNIENNIKNALSEKGSKKDQFAPATNGDSLPNKWEGINQNTGNTAGNTAAMAESMDLAEEELKSLRDFAEQEIINRFTTADLTVNMGGITNQINSNMDLDGIAQYLDDVIFETLESAAEGVY